MKNREKTLQKNSLKAANQKPKLWQRFLTLTPIRISMIIAVAFSIISYIYDITPNGLPLLTTLDEKYLDLKFRLRGPEKAKSPITIAAVDEASLARFGQWPFDRADVIAPMIEKLCSYDIKLLGLDFFWPEIERGMNTQLQTQIKQRLSEQDWQNIQKSFSGDPKLKQAFDLCAHKLVTGYHISADSNQSLSSQSLYQERLRLLLKGNEIGTVRKTARAKVPSTLQELESDKFEISTDFKYYRFSALMNNPAIFQSPLAAGYYDNDSESSDGNYRNYIPVMTLAGRFVPSFALRMAQSYYAKSYPQHQAAPVSIFLPDLSYGTPLKVTLNIPENPSYDLPVDQSGKLYVNYRGPNYTFDHISVADILDESTKMAVKNVQFGEKWVSKQEYFKDRIILLGSTATGIFDIRPRPFDSLAFGVENHANALDNIIHQDFYKKSPPDVVVATIIGFAFLSMAFAWLLSRVGALLGFAVLATFVTSIFYIDFHYLFSKKLTLFSSHLYVLQALLQYGFITLLKFSKEESERRFIQNAFGKFVSPAVIDELIEDPSKLKIGGQKQPLTILFSDVAGFTELSEKIDVKTLTQFLNQYLGAMTDIVQANGGTLDKYIGDAVMAFWGAPLPNDQQAALAVKTAIEMQKKLKELNQNFKIEYGFEIAIRIGINTGDVSVGNFGSSKVFSYTVIGDNVNLASRLEGVNKYYGTDILISEATHEKLSKKDFITREVDTIKVKGKSKPVKIYQVFHSDLNKVSSRLIPLFEEALRAYYTRNWEAAIVTLMKILKDYEDDPAAIEFINRCKHFMKEPPNEVWDGSWEMHAK